MSASAAGGFSRLRPAGYLGWSRLALLVALVLLTVGAWAFTVHEARTMDMPMGVAIRGGASGEVEGGAVTLADGDRMAGAPAGDMGGMAMPGMTEEMPAEPAPGAEDDTPVDGMGGMAASGMAAAGWSVGGAAAFVAVWAIMMAAMMLPAAAPMLLIFDAVQMKRRGQPAFVPTWVFAAGYLLVWTAAGLAVYGLVQVGSDLASRLGTADRETWAPLALGATLVMAGLYQLTPLKRVCLDHCRSPLGFVMGHWRDGRLGALRMGLRHGAYCLGCCWALFAVLVAAGVMSLAWMILLTLVVFVEKVFPQGRRAATGVGAAFVVVGLIVAAGVARLPWTA